MMLVDPDQFRELEETPEHISVVAMLASLCPHCTEEILPGDAITQRQPHEPWCHIGCAYEQDERDADPFTLTRERREWRNRARRQARGRRLPRSGRKAAA